MFFEIAHTTDYAFGRAVFLEPHTLRLRPRCDGSQRVLRFEAQIEPRPAGQAACLDLEGNAVIHAWFDGLTDYLRLRSDLLVETLRSNPFDYLLDDVTTENLPMKYADDIHPRLFPYCSPAGVHEEVVQFARSIAVEAGHRTLPFLTAITQRIYKLCKVTTREEGDSQSPEVTLADRGGACRDLAVLFQDACRAMGIAARFVSGYQEGDPGQKDRRLHAWVEVYLPGAGWRGYDPTLGLTVADRHVAVAAAVSPPGAAPVTGTFRGTGVSSRLHSEIRLECVARR